jgi:hypothetical protein
MFSASFNTNQRSTRLFRKRQLLSMDLVYKAQPYVDVIAKNQYTYGLDFIQKGQPFTGAYDINVKKDFPFNITGPNHPDVQLWQYLGGSASSTTLDAMNTFCNTIDSNGLRHKFYRLNLFCGNDLNSCLIPLYNSSHWINPTYGFSKDRNYNFVESDYVETGSNAGLTSSGANQLVTNGGSKYLDLGIVPSIINPIGFVATNMHLSASVSCTVLSSIASFIFDSTLNFSDIYRLSIQLLNPPPYFVNIRGLIGSQGVNSQITPASNGFAPLNYYISSRISISDVANYQNGVQIGSTNTTSATAIMSNGIPSFIMYRSIDGFYSNIRITNYSIGLGLNSSEASIVSSAIAAFNTALNRS